MKGRQSGGPGDFGQRDSFGKVACQVFLHGRDASVVNGEAQRFRLRLRVADQQGR